MLKWTSLEIAISVYETFSIANFVGISFDFTQFINELLDN